jgi:hypothetical protein
MLKKTVFTKKDKRTNLEKEIDSVLEYIESMTPGSDEYSKIVVNLEKLYKAREGLKSGQRRISPDTVAIIVGNLLGIALILGYEKADIITTKALGFVLKGRV